MTLSQRWGIREKTADTCRLRLVCLPFAGAGVSVFHPWRALLPDWIDVCAVSLPGREMRYREEPFSAVSKVVEEVCPLLLQRSDLPLAFFGHSMGGLIAFELAQQCTRQGREPAHLFLSACRPPHLPSHLPSLHTIQDDDHFLDSLQTQYRKLPDVLLNDAQLLASLVRTLRADFTMFETYRCHAPQELNCPLTAMGGTQDWIPSEDLATWKQYTRGPQKVAMFPGDHFFLQSCPQMVTTQILDDLTPFIAM